MLKKSLFLSAVILMSPMWVLAEETAAPKTSSDYTADRTSWNVGETSGTKRKVETSNLEVNGSAGSYLISPDEAGVNASGGISLGGKVKTRTYIDKINNSSIGPGVRVGGSEIEGGILWSPGLAANVDINIRDSAIDHLNIDGDVGAGYRFQHSIPGLNWDANLGQVGGRVKFSRFTDMTEAGLTFKLGEASAHGSFVIRNETDGKETFRLPIDLWANLGLVDYGIGYGRSGDEEGFGTVRLIDLGAGLGVELPDNVGTLAVEGSTTPVTMINGKDIHEAMFKLGLHNVGGRDNVLGGSIGLAYGVNAEWADGTRVRTVDQDGTVKVTGKDRGDVTHSLTLTFTPDTTVRKPAKAEAAK